MCRMNYKQTYSNTTLLKYIIMENKDNLPFVNIPSDYFDCDNDIIMKEVKKEEATYNKIIADKYGIK